MPKTYEVHKDNQDVEVFQNEHNGKFMVRISEGGSIAPALDGARWLDAEQLIKLGTKIVGIGFAELNKLSVVERTAIMERCEEECENFCAGLEQG